MSAAPAAVAPPPGHPRFPHMDALRALAALGVVAVHISALSGITRDSPLGAFTSRLNVGVAIFFCLSGFLLYRPFAAARHVGRAPVAVPRYLRRRALRIIPAYWVALTLLAIYPGLPGVFTSEWWRYYLFLQPYAQHTVLGGISPAWTLAVEVTFYLALPLYALAARRLSRRADLCLLGALALASLAYRAVLFHRGDYVAISTLPGMVTWFAGGMALALASVGAEVHEPPRRLSQLARHPWLPWAIAAAAFVVCAKALGAPRNYAPSGYSALGYGAEHVLYALIAALVVLPAVLGAGERGARRVLSLPGLAGIGLISYSLFLYHLPVLEALRDDGGVTGWAGLLVVGVPLVLAIAAVSYWLVERPALRLKEGRRQRGEELSGARPRSAAGT